MLRNRDADLAAEPEQRTQQAKTKAIFGRLPNSAVRDTRLGAIDLLVLGLRTTYTDGAAKFGINPQHFAQKLGVGENRISKAIARLKDAGYLERDGRRQGKDGKWMRVKDALTPSARDLGRTGRAYFVVYRDSFGKIDAKAHAVWLYLRCGSERFAARYEGDIAKRFDLDAKTARKYLSMLVKIGLVRRVKTRRQGGRYGSTEYHAVPNGESILATIERLTLPQGSTLPPGVTLPPNGHQENPCDGLPCAGFSSDTRKEYSHVESSTKPQECSQKGIYAPDAKRRQAMQSLSSKADALDIAEHDDAVDEALSHPNLLRWVFDNERQILLNAMQDHGDEAFLRVVNILPAEKLRGYVREACGGRCAPFMLELPGITAIRMLAAALMNAGEGELEPQQALTELLNAMHDRISSQPSAWLNSLALLGLRIVAPCMGNADASERLYARKSRPMFKAHRVDTPEPSTKACHVNLRRILGANGARSLSEDMERDAEGLNRYLSRQSNRELAVEIIRQTLLGHMIDGKPVHSVHTWAYFDTAIREAEMRERMQAEGIRPGDVFGAHRKAARDVALEFHPGGAGVLAVDTVAAGC